MRLSPLRTPDTGRAWAGVTAAVTVRALVLLALASWPAFPQSAPAVAPEPLFEDVTTSWGIDFVHRSGPTLLQTPESIGPGVALLDFDGDGLIDMYFVNGGEANPDGTIQPRHADRLYRNLGGGKFQDVTREAGIFGTGMGNGVTTCDIDNDGYADVYLSGYAESLLIGNNGDGTFSPRGREVGLQNLGFGASSAFADYDRDGRLDLYVANYVQVDYRSPPRAIVTTGSKGRHFIASLNPLSFLGQPNLLFHQRPDGSFEDVTRAARVGNNEQRRSRSLGVVFADLDGDGWPDILVTNDEAPIAFYHNLGNGSFKDVAEEHWINDTRANMGIAVGDCDGDGLPDVFITHFEQEHHELYVQIGQGSFAARGEVAGLTIDDAPMVGWGCAFLDIDADGLQDLVVANGHIYPPGLLPGHSLSGRIQPIAQPLQIYTNRDGSVFDEVTQTAVIPATPCLLGRGLAVGDLDGDGAPDLIVAANNGPPAVLRNVAPARGRRLTVELVGTSSNRSAIGARAWTMGRRPDGRSLVVMRMALAGNGYLSTDAPRLFMGLGRTSGPIVLTVRWPSGDEERFDVPAGTQDIRCVEGCGRSAHSRSSRSSR